MKKTIFLVAFAAMTLSCGQRPEANVEKVDLCTIVGDNGLMVEAIELTVSDARSIKGLKAEDFDLVNNVCGTFIDPETGAAPADYTDDKIVVKRNKNVLRIEAKPFNINGKSGERFRRIPWELHCAADSALNVKGDVEAERHIAILDDCEKGSFTYAGLTREYMLYIPKDEKGNDLKNVPLMVWQIGGGEYDRDMMTVATANRCLVSLATEGIPCAALVFAIANPNYSYSASLFPEKIELIDRNNALQMAFIDTLIKDGRVDGSKLYCAGASSGGGCTMRFMMQFPDRFAAAIPCCAMDPIVPIHMVEEKYEGQFADDITEAFQGKVNKWNGTDMVPSDIDTQAFVKLPMYFVHAASDRTCKVASTYSYFEARKRLGAKDDLMRIYTDEEMASYGIPQMIAHFSWVPLLDDYSADSPMRWMLSH
ncbi:MAG: prolyl oligopeptidase family serine peptidase [Bacteroidales bacterium]|nr:prolyl oligopeptidase family serine peptidase [Bacteroidales bacterium]MBQ6576868.1 prolyl oligopeptidase family serine peptidase [Bacteroidales bacterium]